VDTADPRAARAGALGRAGAATSRADTARAPAARATGTAPPARATAGVAAAGLVVAGIDCAARGATPVGHGTRAGRGGWDADCFSRASRGLTDGRLVRVPRATTVARRDTGEDTAASTTARRSVPAPSRAPPGGTRSAGATDARFPRLGAVDGDAPRRAPKTTASRSRGAIGAGGVVVGAVGRTICDTPRR
jgi:hypothetical protein